MLPSTIPGPTSAAGPISSVLDDKTPRLLRADVGLLFPEEDDGLTALKVVIVVAVVAVPCKGIASWL
tara:strand:- start:78 stop:278 length:201 start_codon:yes stop_codon:yes gene_type:complete